MYSFSGNGHLGYIQVSSATNKEQNFCSLTLMELVENVWSINQVMELEPWKMHISSTEQYQIISHNVFRSSSAYRQGKIVPFSNIITNICVTQHRTFYKLIAWRHHLVFAHIYELISNDTIFMHSS